MMSFWVCTLARCLYLHLFSRCLRSLYQNIFCSLQQSAGTPGESPQISFSSQSISPSQNANCGSSTSKVRVSDWAKSIQSNMTTPQKAADSSEEDELEAGDSSKKKPRFRRWVICGRVKHQVWNKLSQSYSLVFLWIIALLCFFTEMVWQPSLAKSLHGRNQSMPFGSTRKFSMEILQKVPYHFFSVQCMLMSSEYPHAFNVFLPQRKSSAGRSWYCIRLMGHLSLLLDASLLEEIPKSQFFSMLMSTVASN